MRIEKEMRLFASPSGSEPDKEMNYKAILLSAVFLFSLMVPVRAQIGSSIQGRIVDDHNTPVDNAFVELYSDFHVLLQSVRSSSQGRFSFRGLGPGWYKVRVKPFNTNLMEDSQDIQIVNLSKTTSDVEFVDFRLRVDRRFEAPKATMKSTVFAQEVPIDAKHKYEAAGDRLRAGKADEAIADLEAAVKIFPTYFDALSALGREYIAVSKFEQGYPVLLRALDVYKRCGDCYYSLGVAFYKMDQIPAGLKAAEAAVLLEPLAPEAHLLNGILLRLNGDYAKALAALQKSESLYQKPNPEVHWQMSLVYNKMNRNKEAADRLELYLRDSPNLGKAEKESVKATITQLRAAKDPKS